MGGSEKLHSGGWGGFSYIVWGGHHKTFLISQDAQPAMRARSRKNKPVADVCIFEKGGTLFSGCDAKGVCFTDDRGGRQFASRGGLQRRGAELGLQRLGWNQTEGKMRSMETSYLVVLRLKGITTNALCLTRVQLRNPRSHLPGPIRRKFCPGETDSTIISAQIMNERSQQQLAFLYFTFAVDLVPV